MTESQQLGESPQGSYDRKFQLKALHMVSAWSKEHRLVLGQKKVIVLDEATSALDTESEYLIQESLKKLFQCRTCLVIAYRLSAIQRSALIVVMEQGSIIETGTHAEFISKKGRYTHLHAIQFTQKLGLLESQFTKTLSTQ